MRSFSLASLAAFAAALASPLAVAACVGDDPVVAPAGGETDAAADTSTQGPAVDAATTTDAAAADAADGSGPPEVPSPVVTGLASPYALAVSSSSVAILTSTTVVRCPLKDCLAPITIAESISPNNQPYPYAIEVDETDVHWFSRDSANAGPYYFKCPLAGCFGKVAQRRYPSDGPLENPSFMTIGPDALVRIAQKFDVPACGATGCAPSGCVSADSIKSTVFDGTTLFWTHTTDPGGLYRCTPGVAASDVQLHGIAGSVILAHGSSIFTMTATGITACAKAGCGGIPATIVASEAGVSSMAVGPSGVYWTSSGSPSAADGTVKMCPLTGCAGTIRVIATGQAQPTSLRLRDGKLFWVNRGLGGVGGSVMRAGG